jgi:hypothetical protein
MQVVNGFEAAKYQLSQRNAEIRALKDQLQRWQGMHRRTGGHECQCEDCQRTRELLRETLA